ncbi:MAG: peptidoglycan DD-metalloendopeptidase family protein [Mariprofundales bacterium]
MIYKNILSTSKPILITAILVLLFIALVFLQKPWGNNFIPIVVAKDMQKELSDIKKQRADLIKLRRTIDAELGDIGQQLRATDQAIVIANRSQQEINKKLATTNRELEDMRDKQTLFTTEADNLRQWVTIEARAAYKHQGSGNPWLDVLGGQTLSTLAHQQFVLQKLGDKQAQKRLRYGQLIAHLHTLDAGIKDRMLSLQQDKERNNAVQEELKKQKLAKQRLWKSIGKDKQKNAQLARALQQREVQLTRLLRNLTRVKLPKNASKKWRGIRKQKGRFPWPLRGKIVAEFGSKPKDQPKLSGVQIAPSKDRKIRAIAGGHVAYADWFRGFGLMMIVDHGDGLMSVYAHCDAMYKTMGDWVEPGEVLAQAGNTGLVEKVRLYFEIRDQGKASNPRRWCKK